MKKVFLLLTMLLFAFAGTIKADIVEIGSLENAANNSYLPMNSLYNYSFSEQIYTAEEIGMAGTINSFTLWMYGNENLYTMPFDIYMMEVDKAEFASTSDWVTVTEADKVYSGSVTVHNTEAAAFTFVLDTPFQYSGNGNLLIAFNNLTGTWKSGLNGKVFGATGEAIRSIYARRDDAPYDLANLPTATSTTYQRNVITLDITAGGGSTPYEVQIGDGTSSTTGYFPFYTLYNYSIAENLFLASELQEAGMLPGAVTSLSWYANNETGYAQQGINIWMANVTDEALTTTSHIVTSMTSVYENGTVTPVVGWNEFELNGRFSWDGTSNLLIFVQRNNGAWNSTINWQATNAGFNAMSYKYQDSGAYDVTVANTMNTSQLRANIIIKGEGSEPTPPAPVFADIVTDPEELNIGERPIGYWMEPYTFKFMSVDANATINQVINGSDAYMTVNLDTPVLVEVEGEGVEATITTGNAAPGEVTEQFAIDFTGTRGLKTFSVTGVAYEAEEGDVWEVAQEVTVPFTGNAPANMHHNYNIVEGESEDTQDVVYKVTFDTEVMLTAGTNGSNGVARIYTENFNGQPGPMVDNNYEYSAGGGYPPFDDWFGYEYTGGNTFFGTSAGGGMIFGYKVSPEYLAGYGYCYLTQVEAAARDSYPYDLYVLRGGDTPGEATLIYYQEMPEPATAYYFFDMDIETPFEIGEEENLWVMFYSESPYAAYCGKEAVDVDNAKVWYTLNGTNWYYNETYTPVIYLHLEYPNPADRGGVVMNLADMSIKPFNNSGRPLETSGTVNAPVHNSKIANTSRAGYPMLYNQFIPAGTYYIVIGSTDEDFDVYMEIDDVPAPEPVVVTNPQDGATNVQMPLNALWTLGDYTTEMQVLLGTQYPPQTVLIDWTTELFNGITVNDLLPNQSYFMQVNERNSAGTVYGDIIAFTTVIDPVEGFEAEATELYPGDNAVFTWDANRSFQGYNFYQDGVKLNETPLTENTYTVENLEYNMTGYEFQVSAVYDAGESLLSDAITVYMTGNGTVNGHVYDTDEEHPIALATIEFRGKDEYGVDQVIPAITDVDGAYTCEVLAGRFTPYIAMEGFVEMPGAQQTVVYQGVYDDVDIITHEFYYPLTMITATEEEEDVLVEWSWTPAEVVVNFETGDFSEANFVLPATYPWAITTVNPHEGTYCMKSTCEGIASGTSSIEVNVDVPFDGKMGFWVRVSSEANYDKFHFYIDGVEKGAAISGQQPYAYKEFDVTEGTHTYKWEYAKDSSVNSNDDCAYVDDITLYRYDEPLPPVVGATTYDFDDDTMMGWTSIDADGDGNGWVSSANPGIYHNAGVSLSGTGNNASEAYVISGSYANQTGQALTPDNYLVSPAQISAESGAQIQFWACAQDASYAAEHFGVAVSTTTATAAAFTTIQEWTMSALSDRAADEYSAVRGTRQGNWYQYSVDLSAYAGQDIWVAIRHFNCTDMFILNVDDITLATGGTKTTRGDRSLAHYVLHRRNLYDSTTVIVNNNIASDVMSYNDVAWNNLPFGMYQWGIQAKYEGYAPVNDRTREEVVIGEGATTNSYLPTYTYYNYSLTEQIYTADEIGGPCTINSVSFYNTQNDRTRDVVVYMANTTKTAFVDGYDWVNMTATDKVFEGTVTFTNGDWTTITLNTPFAFTGDNLVICVDDNTGDYESGVGFKADNTTTSMALRIYNDYTNFDPSNATNYSGTALTVRNQIKLDVAGSGPVPPTPADGLSEIIWSNVIEKDMEATLTFNLTTDTGTPEGATISIVGEQTYNVTVEGASTEVVVRKGEYDIEVALAGYHTANAETWTWSGEVTADATHDIAFIETIAPVSELYVSPTGWAMWEGTAGGGVNPGPGPGPGPGSNSFTEGFEGGLNGWNVLTVNAAGGEWIHSDDNLGGYDYTTLAHGGTGFAMCYSYVDYVGAYNTDSYMYTPQKYAIENGSTLTFWADNANDTYPENFSVCVSTANNPSSSADFTQVWSGGAKGTGNGSATVRHQNNRYQNWRSHSIDLSAYAGQEVYIAFHDVNYDAYEIWIDDVELSAGSKGSRAALSYKVMLDGKYEGETTNLGFQHNVEGLEEGTLHTTAVRPIYLNGMGDWMYYEWTYTACDNFEGATGLAAIAQGADVKLTWTMPDAPGPGPGPGPGPQPGPEETYDFDNSTLQGWTTIDGGSPSGYGWQVGSTKIGQTGSGHNSSTDFVLSQSYDNNYGVVYPNNFLICPTKAQYTQVTLWACGQDASYAAEHFGIAVSTGGNTSASDFVMVNEWTIGSKGEAYEGPRGARAQSTWTQYTADLSAYAGQEIWVAVRHFNCSDMFYLDVDDITLTTAATKDNDRAMWDLVYSFEGTSGYQYGVASDGENIYTSSWSASSTSMFYKYDLQGNFIEEFNITGCGQLRDMTYDGEYFYGVANASTVYCVDLANHTLVASFTTSYGAMRCITYDPERDGFWVVGNWSGNLTLIDRTGAIVQTAGEPSSASGVAYFKDSENVEHIYYLKNATANGEVYEYNITTGTMGTSPVYNCVNTTGGAASWTGSSGGCFVGTYDNKVCLFADAQQSPQLINIYELSADAPGPGPGPGPGPQPTEGILGSMVFVDGEYLAFLEGSTSEYIVEAAAMEEAEYSVRVVYDGPIDTTYYAMSCPVSVNYTPGQVVCDPVTNLTAVPYNYNGNDGALVSWTEPAGATSYKIYVDGALLGSLTGQPVFINFEDTPDGDYEIGIVAVYANCESDMATVMFTWDAIAEEEIVNAIYPNPTSGDLHINATAMTHVSVFNAMGQMVYDQEVSGDELILNMGQYESGVYMVRVTTETGSSVKRINVVK